MIDFKNQTKSISILLINYLFIYSFIHLFIYSFKKKISSLKIKKNPLKKIKCLQVMN
jgi:hypothetical protein